MATAVSAQPGTDVPRQIVADAGFNAENGVSTVAPQRAVAAAKFEPAAPSPPAAAPTPEQIVRPAGFADVKASAAAPRASTPAARRSAPVEIVFKPKPEYTTDARARRIEGEVILEVEFAATGEVRVLRVVRGLDPGLDEMAARAAEGIRFKPRIEEGRAVDFRAEISIVFRVT